MKVDFYVDVWPGADPDTLYANASPIGKSGGCKRYKITANIPDHAFTGEIDGQAPVEEVIEVDKDD